MTNNQTLRLIFPQWQGCGKEVATALIPELSPQDAHQGYYLGSQLLAWLAPPSDNVATVPVSLDHSENALKEENGIQSYQAIKQQLTSALAILNDKQPKQVLTLGGDCAVSVPAFSYLASQYADDVAVIWLDAHRDLTVPHTDGYNGYHAMALAVLLGIGDPAIVAQLPATLSPENVLIVGLRSVDNAVERQKQLGVKSLSPDEVVQNSQAVLQWLAQTGKKKVLIHFDLDVLDPAQLRIAVGKDPDGISIENTLRVIRDIQQQADIVGLTVAECVPQEVIKLRNLLQQLPLTK